MQKNKYVDNKRGDFISKNNLHTFRHKLKSLKTMQHFAKAALLMNFQKLASDCGIAITAAINGFACCAFSSITRIMAFSGVSVGGGNLSLGSNMALTSKSILSGMPGKMLGS